MLASIINFFKELGQSIKEICEDIYAYILGYTLMGLIKFLINYYHIKEQIKVRLNKKKESS